MCAISHIGSTHGADPKTTRTYVPEVRTLRRYYSEHSLCLLRLALALGCRMRPDQLAKGGAPILMNDDCVATRSLLFAAGKYSISPASPQPSLTDSLTAPPTAAQQCGSLASASVAYNLTRVLRILGFKKTMKAMLPYVSLYCLNRSISTITAANQSPGAASFHFRRTLSSMKRRLNRFVTGSVAVAQQSCISFSIIARMLKHNAMRVRQSPRNGVHRT